jgi:hypothetical protein
MITAYRKRQFISRESDSFISMVIEDTVEGTYLLGTNLITLADCKRRVEFEFPLTNARLARNSIRKAELLAQAFAEYRDVLKKESEHLMKNLKKGNVSGNRKGARKKRDRG